MKTVICLLALLCPVLSMCQIPTRPLQPGDSLPTIVLQGVQNSPVSTIQLQQHKSQLTILDFWASWCSTCIKYLYTLDSLQQQFGTQLQIVLVNSTANDDSPESAAALFAKRAAAGKPLPLLPAVYKDTLLKNMFTHTTVPHYVWLYNNKVLAITRSNMLQANSIANILAGLPVTLQMKEPKPLRKQPKH